MDAREHRAILVAGAAVDALEDDPRLDKLKDFVQDSGEGRWMIADAIEKDVPVPTLTPALFTRFRSRQDRSFAEKCSRLCVTHSADMPYDGNDDHRKRDLYGHTKFAH